MDDQTLYVVTHEDETRARGGGASSLIPTLGAATTVLDQYRTVAIHETNLPDLGAAFTDVAAVAAIAKIAEGGITSHHDLERAEAACQALLLHDVVHVVTHAPKVDFGNGLISYRRRDQGARSEFGHQLFALASSRDFLIAPEMVSIDGGVIASATFADSPLLGRRLDSLVDGYDYWNDTVADAVNAAISQHGIPAYLTDPRLVRTRRGDGFAKRFYHSLRLSWDKAVGDVPPVVCAFSLPPLLAIVLDRMDRREDLIPTIAALREELEPVRRELRELNAIVTKPESVGEIHRRVKYITESFEAIMPEAALSEAQRFQRRFAVVHGLVRPLVKFMAGFVMKTGLTYDDVIGYARSAPDLVLESRSVVDRTVTAKTFSGLVRTEAIQSLVKHHFTTSEIDAIEASMSVET